MVAIEGVDAPCGEANVDPQTATAAVPPCHTVWVKNERGEKLERVCGGIENQESANVPR